MIDQDRSRRVRRLSELARRVIRAADTWAQHGASPDDTPTTQPGHVLLALLLETRSVSSALVIEAGIDLAQARSVLYNGGTNAGIDGMLDDAFAHALRLGSHYVGTEHLLLALTTDSASNAVLSAAGVDIDRLRTRVEGYLTR